MPLTFFFLFYSHLFFIFNSLCGSFTTTLGYILVSDHHYTPHKYTYTINLYLPFSLTLMLIAGFISSSLQKPLHKLSTIFGFIIAPTLSKGKKGSGEKNFSDFDFEL